jgi:hypothetical protein
MSVDAGPEATLAVQPAVYGSGAAGRIGGKQIRSGPRPGFELGRCPYEQAALANPGLACGLHRALAEGMLEALGGAFEVANLVARHPTTAGCRLELRAAGRPD